MRKSMVEQQVVIEIISTAAVAVPVESVTQFFISARIVAILECERVVILVAEPGRNDDVRRVDVVLDAQVHAMVEILARRTVVFLVVEPAIAWIEIIPVEPCFVVIVGVIEKIAAIHFQMGAKTVAVIDAYSVRACDTALLGHIEIRRTAPATGRSTRTAKTTHPAAASPTTTAHTYKILAAEVLLVDVVAHCQHGDSPVAVEYIDVAPGQVPVVSPVAAVYFSKKAVVAVAPRYNVDRFLRVAVVNARKLGLVAQPVKHLDFINHLRRQIFQGCRGIVAKKFFPIYQHFFYLLAVCRHG